MIPFEAVLATVDMYGSSEPAFKALFDQVLTLFDEQDREQLREAHAEAMANRRSWRE